MVLRRDSNAGILLVVIVAMVPYFDTYFVDEEMPKPRIQKVNGKDDQHHTNRAKVGGLDKGNCVGFESAAHANPYLDICPDRYVLLSLHHRERWWQRSDQGVVVPSVVSRRLQLLRLSVTVSKRY